MKPFAVEDLDWVDDFYRRVKDYLILRDEDDILILPPNRVYKVNSSGGAVLRHLDSGARTASFPGLRPGERARQVNTFFSNLKAAYEGRLQNIDAADAVEPKRFTFDFTLLPVLGELAVTYRCNNSCRFCYASCGRNRQLSTPDLPFRKLKQIIRIFRKDAKIPFFSFTGGEPLLRPDLEDMVRFAGGLGLRTNLITNGTLATPARSQSLHDAGLRTAQVSLESIDPAVHNRLTGVPDAWKRTLEGVDSLQQAGMSVQTNTTLTAVNAPGILALPSFLRSIGIRRFAMNLYIPAGSGVGDPDLDLSYTEVGPIVEAVKREAATNGLVFYWYSPTPHCIYSPLTAGLGNKSCAAMDGLLSVSPSGDVLPCSSYPESVGNLLRSDFSDVWFSDRARYFKEKRYAPSECEGCCRFLACQGACPLYWDSVGTSEIKDRRLQEAVQ